MSETADVLQVQTDENALPPKQEPKLFKKRVPGQKIIDRFGNKEKPRVMNVFGISDMCLPPLTRNVVATYRLIGAGEIDRSSKLPREPVDALFPGSYMFYDMGETNLMEKNKWITLFKRPDFKINKVTQKRELVQDDIKELEFTQDYMRLNPIAQYQEYIFMELHPWNKNNKFRPKGISPVFERIDLIAQGSKSEAFQKAAQELSLDAQLAVREIKDRDRLVGMATVAGVSTFDHNGGLRDLGMIKMDLMKFAGADPRRFFSLSSDTRAAVRLTVLDAIHWGLLIPDYDKKRFIIEVSNEYIYTWQVQEDPVEALVEFLASPDGKDAYNAIENMVNWWN